MVFYRRKFNVGIFFSLVVFLLLRQSVSKHKNIPSRFLDDSKLSISQKMEDVVEIPDSSYDPGKKAKKEEEEIHKNMKKNKKKKKSIEAEFDQNGNKVEEDNDIKKKKKNKSIAEEFDQNGNKVEGNKDIKKKKKNKNEEEEIDDNGNKVEDDKNIKTKKKKDAKLGSFNSIDSLLSFTDVLQDGRVVPPEIVTSCKEVDFPPECEATLLSDKKDTNKFDATSIFESSTKALSKALVIAKTSIADPNIDVSKKDAKTCEEMYKDAISALKDAMKSAKTKDKYMTSLKLSTVISDIDTCQEGLGECGTSKLADANLVLSKLSANAICLAHSSHNK